MEEEQIEDWYDKEKERLTQEFQDSLAKAKDKEILETMYKEKMKKLHSEYEKRMKKSIEKRKNKGSKPSIGFFKRLTIKFKK